MIRQHREHVTATVTTYRTKAARKTMVAVDLDGITYLLTPTEAVHLADQLHDRAEEATP